MAGGVVGMARALESAIARLSRAVASFNMGIWPVELSKSNVFNDEDRVKFAEDLE
jgi:hypothetical protein